MNYLEIVSTILLFTSAHAAEQKQAPTASTSKGILVTCEPLAAQVGIDILNTGGNAADAFIATTLAEYVTASGYTSLSGPLGLIYYEARTGKSEYLNAGLDAVSDSDGQWNDSAPFPGKSYVIGGAGRGLEALYKRFGSKNRAFKELVARL